MITTSLKWQLLLAPDVSKVIYREFVIGDADGDNKPDSGVIALGNFFAYYNNTYANYVIYKGDANALATSQNKFNFPDTIAGLNPITHCLYTVNCYDARTCITPGTYTVATLGPDNFIGFSDAPSVKLNLVNTLHYTGPTAQNIGNIIDSLPASSGTIFSDRDYFSCKDNADTIDGIAPPNVYGYPLLRLFTGNLLKKSFNSKYLQFGLLVQHRL